MRNNKILLQIMAAMVFFSCGLHAGKAKVRALDKEATQLFSAAHEAMYENMTRPRKRKGKQPKTKFASFLDVSLENKRSPPYSRLCNIISSNVVKTLRELYNLNCNGYGGSAPRDVKTLALYFWHPHEVDMDAARKLILAAADVFLTEMNKLTEIRPYLHNYPATVKDIDLFINIICADERRTLFSDKVSSISTFRDGTIRYTIQAQGGSKRTIKESYDDARRLAQQDTLGERKVAVGGKMFENTTSGGWDS